MNFSYSLPHPDDSSSTFARGWLFLGIGAVAASGLFSILLVLSRTPVLQSLIPWTDFFHTALVVHVDLSVLIWFLSFICCLWSLDKRTLSTKIDLSSLLFAVSGTVLIILAPFTGPADPSLNNYVPVLQQPIFVLALCLFGIGIILRAVSRLFGSCCQQNNWNETNALVRGNDAASLATVIALLIFLWAWISLDTNIEGAYYYELLFWGAGHTLQICYTVMVLVVYLWLAKLAGISINLSPRVVSMLLTLAALPALFAPLIFLFSAINSPENRIWFTQLMTYAGLLILPIILPILYQMVINRQIAVENKIARATLICSLSLFIFGGVLGFLIEGINVTIPAHYHGSIVGITLAFFGLSYYLLPLLGYQQPSVRLAVVQLYLYGFGQLMHISGLAWSGGYGVQRKTAGAEQGLDRLPEILGMAFMGLGGLIAIIGGILFVVIVLLAIWPKNKSGQQSDHSA